MAAGADGAARPLQALIQTLIPSPKLPGIMEKKIMKLL